MNKNVLILICIIAAAVLPSGCTRLALSMKPYDCTLEAMATPKTAKDFAAVSRAHYAKGEMKCSYTAGQQAIRLDGNEAAGYKARGFAAYALELYSVALDDFANASRLQPKSPEPHLGASYVYDKQGETDEAVASITKALELASEDNEFKSMRPWWFAIRGRYRMKAEEFKNAADDFTNAIELSPATPRYYEERAEAFRKLGKTREATEDERRSAEIKAAKTQARLDHPLS